MTLKDFLFKLASDDADAVDLYKAGIRRGMLDADPKIDPAAIEDIIVDLDDELDLGSAERIAPPTGRSHCGAELSVDTVISGGDDLKLRFCSLRCLEDGTGEEASDEFRATLRALGVDEPKPRKDH